MKKPRLSLQPNIQAGEQLATFPAYFWLLVLLTGMGAGLGGIAMMGLLKWVQHTAWNYSSGDFLDGVKNTTYLHRLLILIMAGVLVGVGRNLLRRLFGERGGEVSAAIWQDNGLIPFWSTIIKAANSIILVGLGAALGREGAPQQIGAAISSKLAIWQNLNPDHRKLLVACGAGAGMAAVYNVPFGAALFASEVLLGGISLPLVIPTLLTTVTATIVSWISLPNESTYTTPVYEFSGTLFIGAIVSGIFAGLAAVLYIRAVSKAIIKRPVGWRSYIDPLVVFMVLGLAAGPFPQLLGNGKNLVQLSFDDQITFPLLAILIVLRPLGTVACLGSGASGGLFTPTLTTGALLGALLGNCTHYIHDNLDVGAWAILGSGAFLGACNKGPLSSIVLVMELRGHLDGLLVPLTVAITIATLISHFWEIHSIYTVRIRSKEHHGEHFRPEGHAHMPF